MSEPLQVPAQQEIVLETALNVSAFVVLIGSKSHKGPGIVLHVPALGFADAKESTVFCIGVVWQDIKTSFAALPHSVFREMPLDHPMMGEHSTRKLRAIAKGAWHGIVALEKRWPIASANNPYRTAPIEGSEYVHCTVRKLLSNVEPQTPR